MGLSFGVVIGRAAEMEDITWIYRTNTLDWRYAGMWVTGTLVKGAIPPPQGHPRRLEIAAGRTARAEHVSMATASYTGFRDGRKDRVEAE